MSAERMGQEKHVEEEEVARMEGRPERDEKYREDWIFSVAHFKLGLSRMNPNLQHFRVKRHQRGREDLSVSGRESVEGLSSASLCPPVWCILGRPSQHNSFLPIFLSVFTRTWLIAPPGCISHLIPSAQCASLQAAVGACCPLPSAPLL